MKAFLFVTFLLLFDKLSAQQWALIPGTAIEFSHFTHSNKDNWFSVHYEYFRKGDKVIGVTRGLTEQFYTMMQETPNAFDAIFYASHLKTTTSLDTIGYRFDSSILKLSYKEAVIIEGWQVTVGDKEVIWQLRNHTWSYFNQQPCFTNVVFHRKEGGVCSKYYNLVFVTAFHMGCEI